MVHRADRLDDILSTFNKYKITPKRLQFCHSTLEKNAKIILIEGKKMKKILLINIALFLLFQTNCI